MDKLIYTYALIKSLCDTGQDYIDCFWPFAIQSFPPDKFVDCAFIQRCQKENYNLEMPLHVLETVLSRAKNKKYIKVRQKPNKLKLYKLTKQGLTFLDTFETHKEAERRINALLNDMSSFFKEHDAIMGLEEITTLLLSFVRKNVEPLIEFINPSTALGEPKVAKVERYDNLLIEYFKTAEQSRPENYTTLRDMILGSIISVVLYAKEPSKMVDITRKKFKHCQVYLDTNFVLSLLRLRSPEFNDPAKELFDLLKKYGFDLKVFSFTVNEICRVISGYLREGYRYPTTVGVDTLYSSLARKGWKKTDAREFITRIEKILHDEGMRIEWVTDVDLKTYQADEELRNRMKNYKPLQDLFHQNHDLASIDKIKHLRGKTVRRIEEARQFFLTSDVRLSRFNFLEMGHKDNGTLCEVILDRLLTNILWLKDPNTELSLKSIIAMYSRDLFIKRRIWDRFYEILKQLRQEGKLEDEAISTLFYHGYIEDILREFDEQEVNKITPDFLVEEIEKAAKFKEEIIEGKIREREREKEEEFVKQLKETVSRKEQEKETEWLEKIQGIRSNLRNSAENQGGKRSTIYASILTLLILACTYGIYLLCKRERLSDLLALILPLAFGGSGITGLWVKLKKVLKNWLVNRFYNKKLSEAKLDEANNT
jgi:predicted nucleic acid-binding protein